MASRQCKSHIARKTRSMRQIETLLNVLLLFSLGCGQQVIPGPGCGTTKHLTSHTYSKTSYPDCAVIENEEVFKAALDKIRAGFK